MKKKWYESLLLIVYIAVVLLALILQLTASQRGSLANVVITIIMLIIVGVVLYNCWRGSIAPTDRMAADLDRAAERIKNDARDSRDYLMTPYRTNGTELFSTERLKGLYRDFLFALDRSSDLGEDFMKRDIEDYINAELVDSSLHRPQLNQVAGAMTGLGILGTFIGLSMGLQSFNTGTTLEITNSIEPLMDGIKVAFHTSIYGMIFSLVFNYVYKRSGYEAEASVSEFVSAFHKYVMPDTAEDVLNRFMAVATEQQADALDRVVQAFIARMNDSLEGSFAKIAKTVDEVYAAQRDNAALMRSVLDETKESAGHFSEINRLSGELISSIDAYVGDVARAEAEIRRTVGTAVDANADTLALLNENKEQLKVEKELLIGMQGTLTGITKQLVDSHNKSVSVSGELMDAVDDLRVTLERVNKRTAKKTKA